MALPPTPAAPPVGAPPPALGAAPPMPMDAPVEEVEEEGDEEEIATICKRPDGTYVLYTGDEPEGGEMPPAEAGMAPGAAPAESEGETFDTPQALVRGVIALLEASTGAEDAFVGATKPGMGAPPPAGGPPKPPMGM